MLLVARRMTTINHQRQGGNNCSGGQEGPNDLQKILIHNDLWICLIEHGVPIVKIDGQPIKASHPNSMS